MTEKTTFTDILKCELTEKEIRQAADDLADKIDDSEKIELERQSVVVSFKAKIAACASKIIQLKNLVRNKYEMRDVKCDKIKDFNAGTLVVTRSDTRKVIEKRKLSANEKQMGLGYDGDKNEAD